MSIELARLETVKLRDVWETEDQHFTPWLAEEENLTLLGETLGMKELEIEGTEINVGDFRADILCKNEYGSRVLIENQLEETDHSHLGQILTYAAGLEVQTVIWIAKKFKDEHRAALDRLNEITDDDFRYFGVEIRVWQIEDSTRAPQFDVVSSPNNWSRTVIQDSQREIIKDLSETQRKQEKFWTEFRKYLTEKDSPLRKPAPQPIARMVFGIGRSGFSVYAILGTRKQQLRIQLTMLDHNSKAYFHLLKGQQEEIDRVFGEKLEWLERPELEESQVSLLKNNTDPMDEVDWKNQHEWLATKLELFDKVFRPRIKALNAEDDEREDEDDE